MKRPRLAAHVASRRHVVAGEVFVTLHDAERDQVARIGAREWSIIACADGTRDLDGIAAAASLMGERVSRAEVTRFFGNLEAAGMLADGPPRLTPSVETDPEHAAVLRWGGEPYRLTCDGSGTCCRIYPTTLFSPEEAKPHPSELFTPVEGSADSVWAARSVTMVDGRCAFLDDALRCRIHETGKPRGCSAFPYQYVADGRELRVGPAPECACVFASVGRAEGDTPGADGHAHVARVPDRIDVTLTEQWSRDAYLKWSDKVHELSSARAHDVPRLLWALAEALAAGTNLGDAGALDPEALAAEAQSLSTLLERRLALHAYRAESDMALAVPRWMACALDQPLADSPRIGDATEAFYLASTLHIHALAFDAPIELSLRRRAIRMLVARALPSVTDSEDPATRFPLALVEAYARAFSL